MLLEKVHSPADIRKFNTAQLKQLCAEIRQYMVECCAKNPGHLGSSLGAVELIVGLHAVYNTPKDKLVFDVGHQAYAHKILGTTFALIYWVQNLGLLVFKRLAGGILGSESGTPVTVELMFTGLCVFALLTAILFAQNSRKHPELRLDAPSK